MSLLRIVAEDAKAELVRLGKAGHIANMNLHVQGNLVSYYRTKSGIDGWENYTKRFLDTYERRDYVCVISDGSLVQLHYEFESDHETLASGSLAYYPNPGFTSTDVQDLINLEEQEQLELASIALELNENFLFGSNYLRIDFQPSEQHYREIIHPCTHIHIGSNNSFRLGANRFPLFSEFMDFVLYAFYPEIWVGLCFGDPGLYKSKHPIDFSAYLAKRRETARNNRIGNKITDTERQHYLLNI